jgi:putative Ca2+/H+ antiporter (TMEM165/GDT1 family)
MNKRIFVITMLTLIAGFVIGMVLSEVIGIVGFILYHRAVGIKYLPIYTAIVLAVIVNLVDFFARRNSKRLDK